MVKKAYNPSCTHKWVMELAKSGRALLPLPSRWCPLILLALGFIGFVFAVFTFKLPGMVGLPLPLSSSSFGNRVSTLFFPGSLDLHVRPQQEKALVPSSTHPDFEYPCMPHVKESAYAASSRDFQASKLLNADIGALPHHHCSGIDATDYSIDNTLSSTEEKRSKSSLADDRNHDMLPSVLNDGEFATCDMYSGKWVEDEAYPLYKPDTCPYVDKKFNCQQNGRPDTKYMRWRWAPIDCKPRFNGKHMLESLRGKRLAFVGDSLNRNQWESMLCMLRESLANQSRVVRQQGSNRILKFLDYNCTVEFYKSRYLVDMKEVSNETNYIVRLDIMDKSETKWRKADVLVFNTGHWWGPGKLGKGENRFQEGDKVYGRLDVMTAYKKALSTWGQWVDTHADRHGTHVFFRTFSPKHFRGQWNAGGHCEDETEPIHEESHVAIHPSETQALEEVIGAMKVRVNVLDVTNLSAYRKDAHPSVYWHPQNLVVQQQDCGHWCLPGLPDTWNELLYFALVKNVPISP